MSTLAQDTRSGGFFPFVTALFDRLTKKVPTNTPPKPAEVMVETAPVVADVAPPEPVVAAPAPAAEVIPVVDNRSEAQRARDKLRFDGNVNRLMNEALCMTEEEQKKEAWDGIILRGTNAYGHGNLRPRVRDRILADCPYADKAVDFRRAVQHFSFERVSPATKEQWTCVISQFLRLYKSGDIFNRRFKEFETLMQSCPHADALYRFQLETGTLPKPDKPGTKSRKKGKK